MRCLLPLHIYIFLMFVSISSLSCSEIKSLGTQEIKFVIPGSNRCIVAEIYFPTVGKKNSMQIKHGIWQRKAYTKDAHLASHQDPYPLVIFSHGWQGDRFGNSWIAEFLVEEGYIVAMVDHTHNTSYEHSDEFVYTSLWQRPLDISALLDHLLQHRTWSQFIDKDRIAVGGFSLGGLTSLWIAGIEGDAKAFKEAMEPYARWSDWPETVKKRASKIDWTKASRSYYDPRVKAVFSIAPDLGKGFKPAGIKQAKVPVLLIVGDQDFITPAEDNADYYYSNLENAELLIIKTAAHYTFMNICSSLGEKITPHLCKNTSSISRFKAHKEAANKIKAFLKEKLEYFM